MSTRKSLFRNLNLLLAGLLSILSFSSCKIRIFPPANLYGVPYEVYKENEAKLKSETKNPQDSTQVEVSEIGDAKKPQNETESPAQ